MPGVYASNTFDVRFDFFLEFHGSFVKLTKLSIFHCSIVNCAVLSKIDEIGVNVQQVTRKFNREGYLVEPHVHHVNYCVDTSSGLTVVWMIDRSCGVLHEYVRRLYTVIHGDIL